MAQPNLFKELHDALSTLKDFLTTNAAIIKPAIVSLKALVPQIGELIDKLITLLGKLKTEVQGLKNVGVIKDLDKISAFTTSVTTVLTAAKNLLPDEAATIDEVLSIANVATSLPSVSQVVDEITALIDTIVAQLQSLKA